MGDISRDTFDSTKHYSQVLMQQGRVQADADWNEQQAITAYREETETKDVIGACGAPVHNAGFGIAIATDGKTLTIGKGRFYVDGILCENDQADLDYLKQPDFPNAPNLLDLLSKANAPFGIVYLDVWQRHITALDDDYIREKALGGPDTATRLKTIWQVRVLPVQGPDEKECARLERERRSLQAKIDKLQSTTKKSAKRKTKATLKKTLVASNALANLRDELAKLEAKIAAVCGAVECITPFPEWDALVAPSSGMLNAHTTAPTTDDVCLIPPSAGYQRLENQLYRVEIHDASNNPTFQWSRDNGIVVASITNISGQDVSVHDVGPDDVLGFANGQWVEVSDDSLELNGLPGELIQIQNVNAATKTITLQSAPALTFKEELHPKLRRWDGTGAMTTNAWVPLEGGIEVQFSDGTYKTGDYWLIPARTATGEIEWPPFETPNTNPIAQPPRGIQHRYCRLALVSVAGEEVTVSADCRNLFPPLTELPTDQAAPVKAFHIAEINWPNDDFVDKELLLNGLQVKFDAPPDPRALNSGAFIVSFEILHQGSNTIKRAGEPFRALFVLDGGAEVTPGDPTVVVWQLAPEALKALRKFPVTGEPDPAPRVRVRLIGNKIWTSAGNSLLYLDGQAFGKAGTNVAGQPRIDLQRPSGSGAKASDFESWFYVIGGF